MRTHENLRVIITAAASGIGRATAEAFVESGADVFICDIDEESLTDCQKALPSIGTMVADVSDVEQVDRFFDQAIAHLGGLDVLVNNAGVSGPTGQVETLEVEDWQRTLDVNINSQFYCARRAVPLLKANNGGSIVNLSSAAGLFGFPLRTPYVASKWAVIGFTKTLAMELGEYDIRVNAICPGPVEGPRIERVIAAKAKADDMPFDEVYKNMTLQNSMQTFVSAQDVANMILFICSEAGQKISGQSLSVDGHTETLRT